MNKNNTDICYYYPNITDIMPEVLSSKILNEIKKDDMHNYLGYKSIRNFKETLNFNFGDKKIKQVALSEKNRKRITKIIVEMQKRFEEALKFKYKPIRYFIFPWFPSKSVLRQFGGLTGMAPYFGTLHLYIDSKNFSEKALRETLAHELNHLYFFQTHNKFLLNIKESMILEGFAETFREYFVGGKIAPWSKHLSVSENITMIDKLKDKYDLPYANNTDVFFGGNGIKKWTGYSVGYYLVKKFLKKNKNIKWEQIMNTNVNKFFE